MTKTELELYKKLQPVFRNRMNGIHQGDMAYFPETMSFHFVHLNAAQEGINDK